MSASWLMSSAMTPAQERQLADEQRHRHQRNSASQLHEQRNHESASLQHLNAVNSGVRKLAACTIDNATTRTPASCMSNATDYGQERQLATCHVISDTTIEHQHPATPSRTPASYMSASNRQRQHNSASWLHQHAPSATPP